MRIIQIDIPEPCTQNWEEMKTCGLNRYCQKCDKEIIDFSFYSDRALVKVIEENKGRICGRFTKGQLNREFLIAEKRKSFFANFSASWIGFWLFLSSPFQSAKAQVKTEISPEIKTVDSNLYYISGTVVNENNESLPFVKIKLFELGLKALTDIDGNFKFVFDDNSFEKYSLEVWGNNISDTIIINEITPNTANFTVTIKEDKFNKEIPMVGIVVVKDQPDVFEPKTWTPRRYKRSRKN